MTILSIESSCDETGASVLVQEKNKITVLSSIISTSLDLHAKTGGIIPEIAAREQVKYMMPVVEKALKQGLNYNPNILPPEIDAVAVTYGPGLIGSLLVGIETAKSLSLLWNKPLISVNHLYGHLYANFIDDNDKSENNKQEMIKFPILGLVVSGAHTDLIYMTSHKDVVVLGQTRDDAAGEAFDKIGRLLNLRYPAGSKISELAKKGDRTHFSLPRPMIGSDELDFSFSGLKTAVFNLLRKNSFDFTNSEFVQGNSQILYDICASVEYAIVNVIIKKTEKALKRYPARSLLVGGGVAANDLLKDSIEEMVRTLSIDRRPNLFIPARKFCTDNAAMIGANAFFMEQEKNPLSITAIPGLSYLA